MKIYNSFIFWGKLVVRTWIMPILFLSLLGYIFYDFYHYRYVSFSPTSALTTSSFVVQFGVLAYLFLGVWLVRLEEKNSMEELTLTMDNAYISQALAKILFGVFTIVFIVLFTFITYLFMFYDESLNSPTYFVSVLLYIILFWGFSFLVSLLIGMIVANWIKGKFIYPVLLFIYCLIIPLNYVFLSLPMHLDLPVDKWLNLGEPNPHQAYHALYGFSSERIHWYKKLIFISGIIFLLLLTYIKKKAIFLNNFVFYSFIFLSLILISSTIYALGDKQVLNDDSLAVNEYYRNNKFNHQKQDQKITLNYFDILLKPQQNLKAEVSFDVMNKDSSSLEQLYLTLYHEFSVQDILVENERVNFEQSGDQVRVSLNRKLKPRGKIRLSFHYEGLESNLYFGNHQALYLPDYFPWLPSPMNQPAFDLVTKQNSLHRIPHNLGQEKEYKLRIDSNQKIYTNLDQINQNQWSGTSSSGISLMSGMLQDTKLTDFQLVYPLTWERAIEDSSMFEDYLNNLFETVSKSLDIKQLSIPETIYFVPNQNTSDTGIGEGTWFNKNQLVVGTNVYVKPERNYFKGNIDYLTYEIVPAMTTKGVPYNKDQYEFNSLFDVVYSQVINRQLDIQDHSTYITDDYMSYKMNLDGVKGKVVSELKTWLKTEESSDSNHPLYKKWFLLIEKQKSWDDLLSLLQRYKKN